MSKSPIFGNNNFTLDGFMDQGRPVNMRITGWLSTRKEDNDNPQKLAVIEQIKQWSPTCLRKIFIIISCFYFVDAVYRYIII